jgi:hypothetical protein
VRKSSRTFPTLTSVASLTTLSPPPFRLPFLAISARVVEFSEDQKRFFSFLRPHCLIAGADLIAAFLGFGLVGAP